MISDEKHKNIENLSRWMHRYQGIEELPIEIRDAARSALTEWEERVVV